MTSDSAASSVLAELENSRSWQEELYRDVHRHPELSHEEHRTAGLVAEHLRGAGYEVHERVGSTGVVGVLANGDGTVVLLRADMDALPVREATGLPYASEETGTDADGAEVPVMHACGHDVHVACLAGAAHLLARGREHWAGTLIALFQPAEEAGDGARAMVDDGLADLVPAPTVALAQHVMPLPAGRVGTRPGPALSAADSMRITVYGRGAHGSMPQAAVDPVVLAAMIVVRLQAVVSREVSPGETAVLTVGSIQAGTKSNVIPDRAVLQLNVRTYTEATRRTVLGPSSASSGPSARPPAARGNRSSSCSTGSRSPTTTRRSLAAWRRRSRRSSGNGARRWVSSPPARTSATSRPRWACRTRTGSSGGSSRSATRRRSAPGGWPRTSR